MDLAYEVLGVSLLEKLNQESNYDCATDACAFGDCSSFRELVNEQNTHVGCGFSLCADNGRT